MKTTAEEFLKENGLDLKTTCLNSVIDGYMRQPDLVHLLENFADLRIKEEFKLNDESFIVEIKNISYDFEILRDMLDTISPRFILDKDTFIYHNCDQSIYKNILILSKTINSETNKIIVRKESL